MIDAAALLLCIAPPVTLPDCEARQWATVCPAKIEGTLTLQTLQTQPLTLEDKLLFCFPGPKVEV